MAYSADSFTALEVPTLAKWNKLWANDASFNDGTGIASGAITNAKLASAAVKVGNMDFTLWPAFLAGSSGSQNLVGAAASVPFAANTEVYDQGNNYNNSTYVFTAPATGVYEFFLFVTGSNPSSSRLIPGLKVNATTYNGTQQTDTYSSGFCHLQINLTAGDTVQPMVSANPANIPTNTTVLNSRFSGRRVA